MAYGSLLGNIFRANKSRFFMHYYLTQCLSNNTCTNLHFCVWIAPKQSRCYYIGLVRGEKEYANFTWNRIPDDTAQDPSSVIAWENGEPDFKDAMEFCVCVWDYTGYAMDIRCGELMPYLCQRKGNIFLKLCLSDSLC